MNIVTPTASCGETLHESTSLEPTLPSSPASARPRTSFPTFSGLAEESAKCSIPMRI